MLEELDGSRAGSRERTDLVVLTVHNKNGYVDDRKIIEKLGFGQNSNENWDRRNAVPLRILGPPCESSCDDPTWVTANCC
jgi:hypothetical protein